MASPPPSDDAVKEAVVEGTWEHADVAFQLFLGPRPAVFGSYGFHCVPHLGCYTPKDYTPSLPIALISVPVVDEERQLPVSVSGILRRCREMNVLRGVPEVFAIIHSGHERRKCSFVRGGGGGKCENDDEFNLILHAWVFEGDHVADTHDALTASVFVGVFEAHGVAPVHLDVPDGGTPFGELGKRSCIIHGRCFSPCNANIRFDTSVTDTAVFFTVSIDKTLRRAVVALHILPIGDGPSDRIRSWIRGRNTLREFRAGLETNVPIASTHFSRLVAPLLTLTSAASCGDGATTASAGGASASGASALRVSDGGGGAASATGEGGGDTGR